MKHVSPKFTIPPTCQNPKQRTPLRKVASTMPLFDVANWLEGCVSVSHCSNRLVIDVSKLGCTSHSRLKLHVNAGCSFYSKCTKSIIKNRLPKKRFSAASTSASVCRPTSKDSCFRRLRSRLFRRTLCFCPVKRRKLCCGCTISAFFCGLPPPPITMTPFLRVLPQKKRHSAIQFTKTLQ